MMRFVVFLLWIVSPTPALAHWGHLGELAGHSHWIAGGAMIAAAVLAAVLKGSETEAEAEDEAEGEEAVAEGSGA